MLLSLRLVVILPPHLLVLVATNQTNVDYDQSYFIDLISDHHNTASELKS